MNSILARCLGVLLTAAALASPAFADTVSLEPGMDRMGGDYKNFAVPQNDPAVCRKACLDDASCKAFTFVKPGIKGPAGMCFMKSSAVAATPNACCTSGVRLLGLSPVLTPVGQGGQTIPIVMVAQLIPPPYDVKFDFDPDQSGLRWQWGKEACFPGAAGKPATCQWIKDIDGFKVYNPTGTLIKTLSNPSQRAAQFKSSSDCFTVKAYKGALESAASVPSCGTNGGKVLAQPADPALAAPTNLRLAKSVAECSAATGGAIMGLMCDAAIKANGQALIFTWTGARPSIDGFRLYDSVQGSALLSDTQVSPDSRLFVIPALKGVKVSDWCFHVRAFEAGRESASTNKVCVSPKAPVPPPPPPKDTMILPPMSGKGVTGLVSRKNFNNGCPWAEQVIGFRGLQEFNGGIAPGYIHKDKNILCGKRSTYWYEGAVMFSMNDVPAKFAKATLKFVSGGTTAILGTQPGLLDSFDNPKTYNSATCIREVFTYHVGMQDHVGGTKFEFQGPPEAYFSYHKVDVMPWKPSPLPNWNNAFDVSAMVRKSQKTKQHKLGFSFEVERGEFADNNMCLEPLHSFTLEIER